ncbi:MAG: hypothetical protein A2015_13195 [Spirochaetes bacterium GWF1_31_7]|nr:MAG: hypothetical protein A2Y30_00600 [Spirochaetes bacterium GWE1_32_154]OHD51535.1 MAG: hypothetical protein A2015_13195 [Spirochaetes bacterium GWF1_31_7]OHD83130.1 MAG: hypothetical protein A2355_01415 [Spirochaetes bacterium RIFOXYB1_FULL_32_8]HBD95887.1 hypothetical protein [Spirochaetia bacterium]HBI38163.1 hypothetical protein [Spirochaetia bacterium]
MYFNSYSVIIFFISILLSGIFLAFFRRKETKGVIFISLLILSMCIYTICYAFQLLSINEKVLIIFFTIGHFVYNFSPLLFLMFSLKYCEKKINTMVLLILIFIPLITDSLLIFNNPFSLLYKSFAISSIKSTVLVVYQSGIWDWVQQIYSFSIFIAVFIIMINKYRNVALCYKKQIFVVLFGSVFPIIGHTVFHLSAIGVIENTFNFLPYLFLFTTFIAYIGLTQFKLFYFSPVVREVIFDLMSEAVIVIDKQNFVVDINNAGLKLLNIKSDMIGENAKDVISFWSEIEPKITENTSYDVILFTEEKEYSFITHEIIISRIELLKVFNGYILIVRDVTENQRLHDIEENNRKLESIGILAAGIAHDFNNLLASIFGSIELAKIENANSLVNDYLLQAINNIDRARTLTEKLLTFSKGGEPITKPEKIADFIIQRVNYALSSTSINVKYTIPDGIWYINYDKIQISQVLDNIVLNSIQAMPMGGDISVFLTNVVISNKEHPNVESGYYVKISVIDTGIGIPKNIINFIFDPFFTTKSKGQGLGLATCHSIINRHKGTIEVESEQGVGTAFHIYLPAIIDL